LQVIIKSVTFRKFYQPTSILDEKRDEMLKKSEKISKLHILNLKVDLISEYMRFKNTVKNNRERESKNFDSGIDIISVSPVKRIKRESIGFDRNHEDFANFMQTPGVDPMSIHMRSNFNLENTNSMSFLNSRGKKSLTISVNDRSNRV